MSDELKKKLASGKPVKDYVLVCTDEKTRKMEYVSPKLLKLDDDFFIDDLLKNCNKNAENINKLVDSIKNIITNYNNLLTAYESYKVYTDARILNLENAIKEMGGNL